jgi:hypothetical protein
MINSSQSEQSLLNKQIKPFCIFKYQLELKDIIQNVIKKATPLDHIYRFTGGLKAEFLGSVPVEDPNAKNYLASYSKEMHMLLKEIVVLFKEALDYYGLSKDVPYYISSLYSEDIRTDVWYDIGGGGIPCFSGLYFIESDYLGTVKINDIQESSRNGSILLFESGKKIVYDSSNVKVLSFSIAPLSMLERQYPNKWIPIL